MIMKVIAAGIVSASFCLLFQVRGRKIFAASLGGALGYVIYLILLDHGSISALFFSSAFMALSAEISARIFRAPATLFLSPALILIVPGGGMFECALKMLQGSRYEAVVQLGNVMMDAGAIAVGIIIVTSLQRFIRINQRNNMGREKEVAAK